jgi:hypothetical protein
VALNRPAPFNLNLIFLFFEHRRYQTHKLHYPVNQDENSIMTEPETTAAQPSFRPSKRRKVIRERRASPSDDEQAAHQSHIAEGSVAHSGIAADREESESNGAVVVQKIRKPRARLGLEVSNSSTSRIYKTGMLTSEGHDGTAEEVHSVGKRFAPQTGLVKDDLDKHM